jgi:hypothetical protein
LSAAKTDADYFISASLDRRFPGVESHRHTVQLINELILAKMLSFARLSPELQP